MASKRVLETSPEQNSPLIPADSEHFKKTKSLTPVELPAILSNSQIQSTGDQENGPHQEETLNTVEQSLQVAGEPWEDNLRFQREEFRNSEESKTKIHYHLPKYYTIRSPIGSGAYGSVVMAVNTRTKQLVAIKKLRRPFETLVDACRCFREIFLAKHIKHRNVISCLDLFTPHRNWSELNSPDVIQREEVYLVMQYGGVSLEKRIVDRNNPLTPEQRKSVQYDILCGIEYLHSIGVIHRDLKPANIAVSASGVACILDFGLARAFTQETMGMTGYVVTKWYRAPELVYSLTPSDVNPLGISRYDAAVDMFSIGAIMAELERGIPLFAANDRENGYTGGLYQLRYILSLMGRSDDQWLQAITTGWIRDEIKRHHRIKSAEELIEQFQGIFRTLSDRGLDLLIRMLHINPRERITAADALQHPYFQGTSGQIQLHTTSTPVNDHSIRTLLEMDNTYTTVEQWKRAVWMELRDFDV